MRPVGDADRSAPARGSWPPQVVPTELTRRYGRCVLVARFDPGHRDRSVLPFFRESGLLKRIELCNRQRHSGGAAKVDFALSSPVPWANSDLALAGTIHLGGTAGQVRAAERATVRGIHVDQPVMLLGQPGSVDDSRAPAGAATLWSYVHVPNGSTLDAAELVTCSVERLAPGFRDTILATSTGSAEELGRYNPNYTGGDINSGDLTVAGLLARPVLSFTPWRTPVDGVYLCSSATPPGPGVHGMAGHWAARTALRDVWGLRS